MAMEHLMEQQLLVRTNGLTQMLLHCEMKAKSMGAQVVSIVHSGALFGSFV